MKRVGVTAILLKSDTNYKKKKIYFVFINTQAVRSTSDKFNWRLRSIDRSESIISSEFKWSLWNLKGRNLFLRLCNLKACNQFCPMTCFAQQTSEEDLPTFEIDSVTETACVWESDSDWVWAVTWALPEPKIISAGPVAVAPVGLDQDWIRLSHQSRQWVTLHCHSHFYSSLVGSSFTGHFFNFKHEMVEITKFSLNSIKLLFSLKIKFRNVHILTVDNIKGTGSQCWLVQNY